MPYDEVYLLRLWRSRAASGWQWAARLDRLPEGESHRFRDPEALLAHLRTVLEASVSPPDGVFDRADAPAGPAREGEG
jgi:hypothetical protein